MHSNQFDHYKNQRRSGSAGVCARTWSHLRACFATWLAVFLVLPPPSVWARSSNTESGRANFRSITRDPASVGIAHPRISLSANIVTAVANLGERVHPKFQNLDFDGQAYQYYERKNADGAVIRQMLIGRDRVEIMNDVNGDGRLESWDIFTPAGKMMFSHPSHDHFATMNLEVTTAKGIMRYAFGYDKKQKTYALYKQSGRPFKKFFANDFIVGCRGSSADLAMEDLAEKLDTALDNGSMAAELRKNLLGDALEDGCKEATFAPQTENLVNGMMKVATSDKKDWSDKNAKPAEQGRYLQCLRYYGLEIYASRMEAGFAQYTSIVPSNKSLWKVRCEAGDNVAQGSFEEGSGPQAPIVTMFEDDATIKKALGKTNLSASEITDQYAKVYFHEMLHYAGMDENNTHTTGDCCGDPNAGPGSKACTSLKNLTENTRVKQAYENFLIDKMSPDGYRSFLDVTRRAWPNSEAGAQNLDEGLMQLAQEYNESVRSPNCKNKTTENPLGTCKTSYANRTRELIDEAYGSDDGDDCRENADRKLGKAEGKKTCELMKQLLLSVAAGGNATDSLKKMCPAAKSTSAALILMNGPYAWAADAELSSTLCRISGELTTGSAPFNYTPIPGSYSADQLATGTSPEKSSAGEGNTSLSPSPTHSKTTIPASVTGPSRPYFANDSTARSGEIIKHIKSTDSVLSKFQKVAQSSFDLVVPKAQAEGEQYLKDAKSALSPTAKNKDFRDGYSVAAAKTSVPDPLAAMNAANSMGAPQLSRGPASAAGNASTGGAIAAGNLPEIDQPTKPTSMNFTKGKSAQASGGGPSGYSNVGASSGPATGATASREGAAPTKRRLSPDEERALAALQAFLQKDDYERVKKDLDRPSVEGALLDHGVQVVDDEGRTYGSGFPEYKYRYDVKLGRLVPDLNLDERSPSTRRKK